jgi:hypothetical protein
MGTHWPLLLDELAHEPPEHRSDATAKGYENKVGKLHCVDPLVT